MIGTNRHTLSADGWIHEQDNFKQVANSGQVLCREAGLNTYKRTTTVDFPAANEYWDRTSGFWALVRQKWDEELAKGKLEIEEIVVVIAGHKKAVAQAEGS